MIAAPAPRVALTALALIALAACGASDGGATASPPVPRDQERHRTMKPDQRTPGAMTIERKGRLAGTLLVTPASIKAGETLSVAVKNAGKVTMFYGLENRIERRTDWQVGRRDRGCLRHTLSSRQGDPAEGEARRARGAEIQRRGRPYPPSLHPDTRHLSRGEALQR